MPSMTGSIKMLVMLLLSMTMLGCASIKGKSIDDLIGYTEDGKASFYADKHQNRKTASGEPYQHGRMTAAHKELPFGAKVKVTNVQNGKSVIVRINDRGPFVSGRIIDLSKSAFASIGSLAQGIITVRIEVIR